MRILTVSEASIRVTKARVYEKQEAGAVHLWSFSTYSNSHILLQPNGTAHLLRCQSVSRALSLGQVGKRALLSSLGLKFTHQFLTQLLCKSRSDALQVVEVFSAIFSHDERAEAATTFDVASWSTGGASASSPCDLIDRRNLQCPALGFRSRVGHPEHRPYRFHEVMGNGLCRGQAARNFLELLTAGGCGLRFVPLRLA
jgi:hypothetical protein